ncbi:MAG: DUF1858 domain-containing protein [Negativicutes bacterium]|nr:DUF1858 domain-containing protein [Negativicutes bacterium]
MITKTTTIDETLRLYPAAREIFARNGMGCIGCMGSVNETLENAASMHEIDIDALLQELSQLEKLG